MLDYNIFKVQLKWSWQGGDYMQETIIGKNVKRIIKQRNIKQKDVAGICGYDPKVFSNMLNGYLTIRDSDIIKIKNGLNVGYNELFTKSEESA